MDPRGEDNAENLHVGVMASFVRNGAICASDVDL